MRKKFLIHEYWADQSNKRGLFTVKSHMLFPAQKCSRWGGVDRRTRIKFLLPELTMGVEQTWIEKNILSTIIHLVSRDSVTFSNLSSI